MEKNKINIDQYFKTALQNFEGNADEAMFDAIKQKVDASKVSVDDYFKNAMLGYEVNADDIPFDAIKSKVAPTKVSIDNYFKEGLLDFNADAVFLPFSAIQSKIDPNQVIDEHFKEALKNYEGMARDEEFAVIRERVLKIQQRRSRLRYTFLLLLLLIPALFGIQKYFSNPSKATPSDNSTSENTLPQTTEQAKTPANSNTNLGLNEPRGNGNTSSTNKGAIAKGNQMRNPITVNDNVTQKNEQQNKGYSASANNGDKAKGTPGNITLTGKEDNKINHDNVVATGDENKAVSNDDTKTSADETKTQDSKPIAQDVASKATQPDKITLRKPHSKFTLQVSGAATYNSRYLNTRVNDSNYLTTRNESDKGTIKNNFGVDLLQQMGKFSFGIGLHENQFGQEGSYHLLAHLFDSVPVYDTAMHIIGYFRNNQRDSAFQFGYNNKFVSVEIPLQASFKIWSNSKWDYEIGAGALLSYLASAQGTLPTMEADGVVQLRSNMNTLHHFGVAVTVAQKIHYNMTTHWQLGTEIYLKTNVTSLYKNNTGIMEYPYSFGWRWGIGYKF